MKKVTFVIIHVILQVVVFWSIYYLLTHFIAPLRDIGLKEEIINGIVVLLSLYGILGVSLLKSIWVVLKNPISKQIISLNLIFLITYFIFLWYFLRVFSIASGILFFSMGSGLFSGDLLYQKISKLAD